MCCTVRINHPEKGSKLLARYHAETQFIIQMRLVVSRHGPAKFSTQCTFFSVNYRLEVCIMYGLWCTRKLMTVSCAMMVDQSAIESWLRGATTTPIFVLKQGEVFQFNSAKLSKCMFHATLADYKITCNFASEIWCPRKCHQWLLYVDWQEWEQFW